MRHGPYTIEGMLEGLGEFARGARRAVGWRRWLAILLAVWMLGVMAASLLGGAVAMFR